ncbi:OmpH family outer membrane protein [Geobacter argillaceus]|uniref:Periplasmic chaperone for outer membrane proteins Skp n=1 Tax=Geobacter argillaceus TaxID=345631 RepID=A0A562VMT9_9BACT|nr:OmpH family outer membrane protein [Geobacter argillaceus]TWJ19081.1 periplasmic chaperone for outer membrane proteins Skp [Geobacter argillaceus]
MMNRFISALIFLSVVTAGQAQASTPLKIGVVDLQRAVSESKEGIAARADLLKKTEQFNAELKVLLADFEKMRAEFDKDSAKLSADERAEKEKLLQKKGREFQSRQREAQEELKQIEADYLKKLLARLGTLMTKLGSEGNYSVVLDRAAGVYYFGKEVDVTAQLVQRADDEL